MKKTLFVVLAIAYATTSLACTSLIISGRATADGRPVMLKHRDTGTLDNRIDYFAHTDSTFAFIGLVNVPNSDGSVWTGTNEAGFSIMNTASYNLRRDSFDCPMDQEGVIMRLALQSCRTTTDFESMLSRLLTPDVNGYVKPLGVEANFGVIDAAGGAAYYEVNNFEWTKFDVNEEPAGYRVHTNFSFSGRENQGMGYERYFTASAIMKENQDLLRQGLDHRFLFDSLSRSYRHEVMGVNYNANNAPRMAPDVNFIPRRMTSASVVIEGVRPGENPLHTVMWTLLGYPACTVALPLLVGEENTLPACVQADEQSNHHSPLCDTTMRIKNLFVFPLHCLGGNSSNYFSTEALFRGEDGKPSILSCAHQADRAVYQSFHHVFTSWRDGKIYDARFWQRYRQMSSHWFTFYQNAYQDYLRNN